MIFNLGFQILIFSMQLEVMDHKVIGFMTIMQFEHLKIVFERLRMSRVMKTGLTGLKSGQNDPYKA